MIGSVHVYADSPFHAVARRRAGPPAGRSPEIVAPYFDEVLAAIRSGLFDTIGHLDFVKRYLVPHVTPAQLAAAPGAVRAAPRRASSRPGRPSRSTRAASARRAGETYPAAPIVERYRVLGGTAVSAGSDAHRRDAFTAGLEAGYGVVAAAGFGAACLPSWRSQGRRGPAGSLPHRTGVRRGAHLTKQGSPSL